MNHGGVFSKFDLGENPPQTSAAYQKKLHGLSLGVLLQRWEIALNYKTTWHFNNFHGYKSHRILAPARYSQVHVKTDIKKKKT